MSQTHQHWNKRIFGLDFMRASAIIMVLLGHLTWILPKSYKTVNILLSMLGFVGVEVFFVLSGFLIGRILMRMFENPDFGFPSIKIFIKRRWFRTFPNYFLVLCLNIAIGVGIIGYEIDGLWRYFFFLQNFTDRMPVFFPESWSLSVEEFAYILVPLFLFLTSLLFLRSDRKKSFIFAVVLLYLVFFATKIGYNGSTNYTTLDDWNVHLKGVVIFRVDAIITGIIAAWLAGHKPRLWSRIRWLAAFFGLCAGTFLIFGVSILNVSVAAHPVFWNILFLPLLSLSIAALLPLLTSWKRSPYGIGRPVVGISLLSYAMYLLHYGVVLQLLNHFALAKWGWEITAVVYFLVTILLSALLYRYYEKPLMDLRE